MCAHSSQICQCLDEHTKTKIYKDYHSYSDPNDYLNGSYAIKDISPQFVEDVQLILEKFDNNTYVTSKILAVVSDFFRRYKKNETKIRETNFVR